MQQIILRKMSADAALYFRQLSNHQIDLPFDLFGREWTWKLSKSIDYSERHLQIKIDWGGSCCELRLDESWVWQIAESVLGLDHVTSLDDSLRPLVLEAGFSEATDVIERYTRKRFRVLSFDNKLQPEKNLYGFEFIINDDAIQVHGEIWVDFLGLGYLANAIRLIPQKSSLIQKWSHLSLPLRFELGWVVLPLTSLTDVSAGDVLLLDECRLIQHNTISLKVTKNLAIEAKFVDTMLTIISDLEEIMYEDDDIDAESADLIKEISIRVSFDLGERSISLKELCVLKPGYVFELGRDLRRSVNIRANGKLIGEGELVDIDGQTGVSVLRFYQKPLQVSDKKNTEDAE
jgi:type III secretion protein Q